MVDVENQPPNLATQPVAGKFPRNTFHDDHIFQNWS